MKCSICNSNPSKYTCPSCSVQYCSVACYKSHKAQSCATQPQQLSLLAATATDLANRPVNEDDTSIKDGPPLKPLSSIKWPYVLEESSFPDPLKRDDPKTLQLRHYEAIATSKSIRTTLLSNPSLKPLLTQLDTLRGVERERALQRALGVTPPDIRAVSSSSSTSGRANVSVSNDLPGVYVTEEQTKLLRELAEAVEGCVRDPEKGGSGGVQLGLDWEKMEEEGHETRKQDALRV